MDLLARGHRSDRRRLVIRSRKQIDVVTPHTGQIDLRRTALPKPAVCAIPVCRFFPGDQIILGHIALNSADFHVNKTNLFTGFGHIPVFPLRRLLRDRRFLNGLRRDRIAQHMNLCPGIE